MRAKRFFLYVLSVFLCSFFVVVASNPSSPIVPSDNIQDPGDSGTAWGGCGPTDSNCYITFAMPSSATPSVTTDGMIAFDTTVTDLSTGLIKFYGNEEQGIISLPVADFDTLTDGYAITYNATDDEFELAAAGASLPINDLTAADGTNTINNATYAQEWQWNTLAGGSGLKLSSTSTAATGATQKLFEIDLSGANASAGQATYGAYVSNAHSGATSTNIGGYFTTNSGTTNYGLVGEAASSGGAAIWANSAASGVTALLAKGFQGLSIDAQVNSVSATDSVVQHSVFSMNSAGGVTNGFGLSLDLNNETSTTDSTLSNQIISKWTDATHATRTSAFEIWGVNSATLARKLAIAGSGQLTADAYGSGTFTGTDAYWLAVDSSGNIIEEAAPAAGASALNGLSDCITDYATDYNMFCGDTAGDSIAVGGQYNIAFGQNALTSTITGDNNVAIGYGALDINTGTGNLAIGTDALGANVGGLTNLAIGYNALLLNTSSSNLAIGYTALDASTSGDRNFAIGSSALSAVSISDDNLALGYQALLNNTASNNLAIGSSALDINEDGTPNIAIGVDALGANISGNSNIAMGYQALLLSTAGTNLAIGHSTGDAITTGTGNILIGNSVDTTAVGAHNELNIGNTIYSDDITVGHVGFGLAAPITNLHLQESNTDTVPTMEIEQLSTGDAGLQFSIVGDAYAIGIDNSSSDQLKVSYAAGEGTAALGTGDIMVFNPSGYVGIGGFAGSTPKTNLHIWELSASETTPAMEIETISSTSDAALQFSIVGDAFAMGIDNTTDAFNISYAAGAGTAVLGTGDYFTIEPGGEVGIGDSSPDYLLDVEGNVASSVASFFNDGNLTTRAGLIVQVGVDDYTAASTSTLLAFNDGDGTAVGSITFGSSLTAYNTTSDIRLKENVVDTALSIDDLMNVQIRDFTWISDKDKKLSHGFIAQELYDIYPSAVTVPNDPNDYYMVDYSKLMPLAIKSIQDLNLEIKDIQNFEQEGNSFGDKLRAWLGNVGNGIQKIFAKEVRTEVLCVGNTCVNENQLKALLNGSNNTTVIIQQNSSGGGGGSSTGGGATTEESEENPEETNTEPTEENSEEIEEDVIIDLPAQAGEIVEEEAVEEEIIEPELEPEVVEETVTDIVE